MTAKAADTPARIKELHACWNSSTGQQLPLLMCDYAMEWGYVQFLNAGYSEPDIVTVVRYLKRKIKEGTRQEASLRWSNCIGNVLRFSEDLSFARAAERSYRQPDPKERALEALRPTVAQMRPEDGRITARPVGDLIADLRKAAGM